MSGTHVILTRKKNDIGIVDREVFRIDFRSIQLLLPPLRTWTQEISVGKFGSPATSISMMPVLSSSQSPNALRGTMNSYIFTKHISDHMRSISTIFILLLVFMTSAQCQQTAVDWYNKGDVLASQGKYNEAIQAYNEAIQLKPNYENAWYNKGVALKALGRINESEAAFAKAKNLTNLFFSSGASLPVPSVGSIMPVYGQPYPELYPGYYGYYSDYYPYGYCYPCDFYSNYYVPPPKSHGEVDHGGHRDGHDKGEHNKNDHNDHNDHNGHDDKGGHDKGGHDRGGKK